MAQTIIDVATYILERTDTVTTMKLQKGRVQLSVYPSFCLKGLMHDE